jgi:hypothetical protein
MSPNWPHLILTGGSAAVQVGAQTTSPCDTKLQGVSRDIGYKQRDNPVRCEGFYQAPTGGQIELLSLVRWIPPGNTGTKDRVAVVVPGPPTNQSRIAIRVSALTKRDLPGRSLGEALQINGFRQFLPDF